MVMSTSIEALPFDAGNLGLDFINTRGGGDERIDLLRTGQDLRHWMVDAGLSSPDSLLGLLAPTPDTRILLNEAKRLRDDIEALVGAFRVEQGLPGTALHNVNRTLAASREGAGLRVVDGSARLETFETSDSLLAPLVPIALAAAQLLVAADPNRVRRCASKRCGLWFLDSSKNGRRRWCSMARCGNRAKVARHYKKRSATA